MLKRKKIKELGEIVNGGTPSTKVEGYWDGNIPWITPNDLSQNRDKWIESGERNITEFGVENSNTKLIPANSIMISTRAPVGYVVRNKVDATTNQGIKSFVPNTELVDADYMYYFFVKNTKLLNMRSGGTTFRELSTTSLKNLEVKIPDIEMQKEISGRISVFDDKMSLNNELISSLEEYSQLIFHKWFVDFNFPNEEGKPYKDNGGEMFEVDGKMIPVGWTREKIGKWKKAELIKSGILEFEGEKRYITTSDVVGIDINLGADKVNYGDRTSRANMQPELNSVWFAKMQNSPKHIFITEENFVESYILSTGFAGLRCDEISFPYIATFVNSRQFEEMKNLRCNGSTQKAINDEGIKTIKVVIPNEEVLSSFSKITYPIYKKINLLQQENQLLEETRDLLIKKLIK